MRHYDLHGKIAVSTDADLQIPDYFEVEDVHPPTVLVDEGTVMVPDGPGKRCGAFSYWSGDGLTVQYKTPTRSDFAFTMHLDDGPFLLRYTPGMEKHGEMQRLGRTVYELACIRQGYPLVHAGAISRPGNPRKAALVTAPPDSGKTSTVLSILDEQSRFLGDDHVMIEPGGTVYAYPRTVNISPFTLTGGVIDQDDSAVQSVKRRMAASRFELLFASAGIEMGERREVDPSLIDSSAAIDKVFVLGSGDCEIERISSADAANHLLLSTLDGFDPFGHYALLLCAHECGADLFGLLYRLRSTIEGALGWAECWRVNARDVREYPKLVESVL